MMGGYLIKQVVNGFVLGGLVVNWLIAIVLVVYAINKHAVRGTLLVFYFLGFLRFSSWVIGEIDGPSLEAPLSHKCLVRWQFS
jgi:hypothetical protein